MSKNSASPVPSNGTEAKDKTVRSRQWFKMRQVDILTNHRIVRLNDADFRAWVELLALANDTYDPGKILMPTAEIAMMLRKPEGEVRARIDRLLDAGLFDETDRGLEVVNSRDFYAGEGLTLSESPEGKAARKRAQRERERQKQATGCHGDSHGDAVPEKENENSEGEGTSFRHSHHRALDVDDDGAPKLDM